MIGGQHEREAGRRGGRVLDDQHALVSPGSVRSRAVLDGASPAPKSGLVVVDAHVAVIDRRDAVLGGVQVEPARHVG